MVDIHNYRKRLEQILVRLEKENIDKANKKYIRDFSQYCIANGISAGKVQRYMRDLIIPAKWVKLPTASYRVLRKNKGGQNLMLMPPRRFKYVYAHFYTRDKMVNITLAIPKELKEELQKHDEVNWSAVIRKALQEHLRRIEIVEAIAQKSKLTEKDAEELARKVKREMAKRHGLINN